MQRNLGSRYPIAVAAVAAVAAIGAAAWWAAGPGRPHVEDAKAVPRPPRISPDYVGIVLPPNIAPANLAIREDGQRFFVRMQGAAGEAIEILSRSTTIAIPPDRWRRLLEANRGKELRWDVYAEVDGQWSRYSTIANRVADDEIDPYLVYRLIPPVHNKWLEVGVYQRQLTTFEESAVLEGKRMGDACVNCHSFRANDPQQMLIGIRGGSESRATLLADDGHATKLGTPIGYTAWHPSGRIAAYSANKTQQFFHTAGQEVRDVVDLESALMYFRLEGRQARRVPGVSDSQHLTTYPAWSPDGRWLYYCRAPVLWTDHEAVPPEHFAEVRYDLMRISYDIESDRWGSPETVLAAKETGLSILLPRISPDGRFLLFCMCQYGCFPAFQPTSDLYLMDLEKGTYAKLPINSEFSESWHSWSSNSRWIAFSSKRAGDPFTRCYLSYLDPTGQAHKPFVVPQADPEFYGAYLKTFSVPELLTGPVSVSASALVRAARSKEAVAVETPADGRPKIDDSEPYRHADR
jgi:hypothetical protein